MTFKIRIYTTLLFVATLISCAAGHQDFIDIKDKFIVGREIMFEKIPHKFADAGQFYRGDYVVVGDGLTNIEKKDDGNLIYHVFSHEILPNAPMNKEWIGKCLIYYVVDSRTKIVLSWGFDKGGNPLACRSFQYIQPPKPSTLISHYLR